MGGLKWQGPLYLKTFDLRIFKKLAPGLHMGYTANPRQYWDHFHNELHKQMVGQSCFKLDSHESPLFPYFRGNQPLDPNLRYTAFRCTVKRILREHCHERPLVLKQQLVWAESPTFQCKWTCHQRSPTSLERPYFYGQWAGLSRQIPPYCLTSC